MNAVGGVLEGTLAGGGAWYLSNWFSLAVLALWALVPAAVGYLRYSRADL